MYLEHKGEELLAEAGALAGLVHVEVQRTQRRDLHQLLCIILNNMRRGTSMIDSIRTKTKSFLTPILRKPMTLPALQRHNGTHQQGVMMGLKSFRSMTFKPH